RKSRSGDKSCRVRRRPCSSRPRRARRARSAANAPGSRPRHRQDLVPVCRAVQISAPNSCSSAERWLVPSPRTRRDSAMPSLSMICFARTLPTPGRDSSRAETFILPITSSVAPSLMTSDKLVAPRLRRFFTSARSLRALAAFSSAAARSSGVRGGRATRGHLGFRWKKVCREGKLANHVAFRQRKLPITSLQIEIYYFLYATYYLELSTASPAPVRGLTW